MEINYKVNSEVLYTIGYDKSLEKYFVYDAKTHTRICHTNTIRKAIAAMHYHVMRNEQAELGAIMRGES